MAEFLPGIDIAVSIPPREFLERMAAIAEQSGLFTVERHYDAVKNGKLDIVNCRFLGNSPHTGLGGQLIAQADLHRRILVEMRAQWWDPDPPTRVTYCAAATELMLPLLRIYNRTYRARHRFRIQKAALKRPQISLRTKTLFERFAILANTASLHPLDWDRFYAFVGESRQELPEYEIRAMLVDKGFSREKADHLAEIYIHLWSFKRRQG